MKMNRTATSVAALLLLGILASCAPLKGDPALARPDVTLWGDSFGESVAPYLSYDERVYGGTSPCTWIDNVVNSPAPQVAVMVFVGNELNTCDYVWASRAITQSLQSRGSHVIWVAAPPIGPNSFMVLGGADRVVNSAYEQSGGTLAWGPAHAVGAGHRGPDGLHLNDEGAQIFASAISQTVGR